MKTNIQVTQKRKRKGFTLVELLVVIAIIASLAGLSYGPIMKHLESSARTEAISNGKNIYTALLGFMTANDNVFPNTATVTAAGGTAGTTSNGYFQQLFDGGNVSDEKYFYHRQGAKMGLASTTTTPNNDKTLDTTECVWGYVAELDPGDSTSPLLFDSSSDGLDFLTNTWKGKAVIIKVDGGAKAYNIKYTLPLDPTDVGQSGKVNIDLGGTPTDIMTTVPVHGVITTPG
jgi:prepilin-type N-terminal cleavage/methylation domain-containing protein